MIEDDPTEDYLEMMTIYFEKPEITETSIRIPVRDIYVFKGFLGHTADSTHYERCLLVYDDVISSVRTVAEYSSRERKDFERRYTITDGPFSGTPKQLYRFHLEGVSDELNAYVRWEIVAAAIRIEKTG